jgi:hypothetical protein
VAFVAICTVIPIISACGGGDENFDIMIADVYEDEKVPLSEITVGNCQVDALENICDTESESALKTDGYVTNENVDTGSDEINMDDERTILFSDFFDNDILVEISVTPYPMVPSLRGVSEWPVNTILFGDDNNRITFRYVITPSTFDKSEAHFSYMLELYGFAKVDGVSSKLEYGAEPSGIEVVYRKGDIFVSLELGEQVDIRQFIYVRVAYGSDLFNYEQYQAARTTSE